MERSQLETNKDLELNNNNNVELEKEQNDFVKNAINEAVKTGIHMGIKTLLPDFIEDKIIELTDELLDDGNGNVIDKLGEIGKNAKEFLGNNFKNISQVQEALKNGNIMNKISETIDSNLNKLYEKGKISSEVIDTIKNGKEKIVNNIENNLEEKINTQTNISKSLDEAMNNWKKYYDKKDFDNMEIEYEKIKKELSSLMPLESSITQARNIENIHNLIKNNGHNFNLSNTELELAKKLA